MKKDEIPTVSVELEHVRGEDSIATRAVRLREPTRQVDATDAELIALLDTSDVLPGDVLRLPGLPLGFEVLKGGRDESGRRRVGLRTRIIVALLLALVGWAAPATAQQTVITADTVLLEMARARGQITAAETQATKALALPMSDSARTEAVRARGFIRGARTQTLKAEAKLATMLSVGLPGVPVIRDTVFAMDTTALKVLDLKLKPDTVRIAAIGDTAQVCATVTLAQGFVGVSPATAYCLDQLTQAALTAPPVGPTPLPVPVVDPAPADPAPPDGLAVVREGSGFRATWQSQPGVRYRATFGPNAGPGGASLEPVSTPLIVADVTQASGYVCIAEVSAGVAGESSCRALAAVTP